MKIFITSDQHFRHERIRILAARSARNTEEMDQKMLEAWNQTVRPNDLVYHLGDLAWGDANTVIPLILRLNGTICMIAGNHDRWLKDCPDEIFQSGKLELLPALYKIKYNKTKLWLCHYPLRCWEGSFKGAMHLYGHAHGNIEPERLPRSMDVGVDAAGIYPLFIGDIWTKLNKEPIIPEEARIRDAKDNKELQQEIAEWKATLWREQNWKTGKE